MDARPLPSRREGRSPPTTPPAASAPRSPRYTEQQQLLAAQTRRLLCEGRKGNESFQAGKELTRALSAWPGAKCDLRTPLPAPPFSWRPVTYTRDLYMVLSL